jgi:uncharacterized protein YybS (DUF2232 family)
MNQSKKLTDGTLLTAIFIIMMLMAIFVPGSLMILIFVLPLPFIIYAYRYDWKPSLIMFGVAILITLLFATMISLPITVLVGLGGIMIGTAAHRKMSVYETLGRGTIGFIAGLLLIYIFTQVVLQVNLANEVDIIMQDSIEMSREMVQQIGLQEITDEELKPFQDQLSEVKDLIPVGITIIAIILAFISQWVGYKFLNRLEKSEFRFPPFRKLRIPVAIVWIYFFSLVFMLMDLEPNSTIYLVANNVFTLVGMLLVLQGFSFMFFIADLKKWPKSLPIIGVIITLFLPFVFLYFVRILGIIDIGFGTRTHLLKKKK